MDIVLASNSPRRRELLGNIVREFKIAPAREVEETYPVSLAAEQVAPFLSRLKAKAYADLSDDNKLVITADTVVILDGRILGKPSSTEDAQNMLRRLSSRRHKVVTGVTLTAGIYSETIAEETIVEFDELSDDEINYYISAYKPFDKAGSYGIQEWIGYIGIARIEGCFYNVMGLPLHTLRKAIDRAQSNFPTDSYCGSTSK